MKEYVMSLLGASLLMGILGTLCPKKHERHVRLLSGLCTVLLLIAPLPTYLEQADLLWPSLREEIEEEDANIYDEIYYQAMLNVNINQLEETTENRICQVFSANSDNISVWIDTEERDGEIVLKKAIVGVRGDAVSIDPREIRNCVTAFLDCPCEIVYQ